MTTSKAGYALLRQRNFGMVWFAGLVSLSGDWALKVALPIVVLELTGSVAATSGVVIAAVLPALLFGPLAGVFVDRWDRRRVMIIASIVQAMVLLPLLAVDGPGAVWIVYAVSFAESALKQFFAPAEQALLPMLVADDQLVAGNALNAVNNNLARLGGPALGGLLAAWSGLLGVVLVDAATFLLAATLLIAVRGRFVAPGAGSGRTCSPVGALAREFTDGLRVIRGSRILVVLLVTFAMASIGEGLMGALFAVYVKDALHGGAPEFGWLMSAQAVGGIAGGVAGGWFGARFSPVRLIAGGAIGLGVVDLVLFTYPVLLPQLWPGLVLLVIAGVPAVLASSAATAMIQTSATQPYAGRVFAVSGTANGLCFALGASAAAGFGERLGATTMLIGQGMGWVVAGAVIALLLGGRSRVPAAKEEPGVRPVPGGRSGSGARPVPGGRDGSGVPVPGGRPRLGELDGPGTPEATGVRQVPAVPASLEGQEAPAAPRDLVVPWAPAERDVPVEAAASAVAGSLRE